MLGATHLSRRSGFACCGTSFPADPGPGSLCAACLARPPAFTKARAILAYDKASRSAILALKHADRLELVPGFARWLGRVGRPLKFIQTLTESRTAPPPPGAGLDRPFEPLALVCSRRTLSQGAMPSARARRKNVLSAFKVPERERVKGRRVLLVDDVLTTGAIAEACARALKRAGAADITVLTLARVVKASEGII